MLGPQRFVGDGEGALVERLGGRVLRPPPSVASEIVEQMRRHLRLDLSWLGMVQDGDGVGR